MTGHCGTTKFGAAVPPGNGVEIALTHLDHDEVDEEAQPQPSARGWRPLIFALFRSGRTQHPAICRPTDEVLCKEGKARCVTFACDTYRLLEVCGRTGMK